MPFDSITTDPLIQRLIAAGIFGVLAVAALVIRLVTGIVARRLDRGTAHAIAPQAVRSVRNIGALFVFSLGVFLGLAALPDAEEWRDQIGSAWTIIAALLVAQGATSVVRIVLRWYARTVAPRTAMHRMVPLVRRMLILVIYGIAALLILNSLGMSISPILGGLGITGLAVALALQPTLANFFAGTYVLSDGAISVGDYIDLNGGPAGYVVEVGWRSTKIRTWLNNLVIIPNSVMADSIVTNYSSPDVAMNILVSSGVSYDSDLARVEEVSLEVARELQAEAPEAVNSVDAFFGFEKFADSNVEFWVFLQARDRWGSFVLTNLLIQRLHARFKQEGIEINYPVRKLVYNGAAPPTLAAPAAS
jgi:small-conductance mechanosensitive channel